jgi:DNA-binding FadR family transcriptional regulator
MDAEAILELRSRGLSLTELALYLLIERYAGRRGWCSRAQHMLALALDVSERTVRRAERRLSDLGLAEARGSSRGRQIRVSQDAAVLRQCVDDEMDMSTWSHDELLAEIALLRGDVAAASCAAAKLDEYACRLELEYLAVEVEQ